MSMAERTCRLLLHCHLALLRLSFMALCVCKWIRSKIREDHDKKGTAQRQHLPGGLWSCKPQVREGTVMRPRHGTRGRWWELSSLGLCIVVGGQYTEDEDDDEDGEEEGGVPEGPPVAGWRFKEEEKDEDQEERDGPGAIDLQGLSIEHSQRKSATQHRSVGHALSSSVADWPP